MAGDFPAVLEQNQAGDRTDAQLPGQLRIGLAVELGQTALADPLTGRLLKHRCKRLARPAPLGPHIQQQRQIAFDLTDVIGLIQVERFAQQHLIFAASALGMLAHARGGDAVQAVAVRAGDQQRVSHGVAPLKNGSRRAHSCAVRQRLQANGVQVQQMNAQPATDPVRGASERDVLSRIERVMTSN
ncbi:hypothetical protein PLUA15_60092 [Pseudomonas lundensis]|uniref:Uncharacterized protein n=1 Tax=Pseudomonas lundensis TaxID=86185 RepID=A0AAX2HDL7_9PSED|nr:hypothetical protein PLUA15_60092 [Pseudomonas lundensis]